MAFTYLILNLVFLGGIVFILRRYLKKPSTTWWLTLIALLVLTAIFDNIMIATGFFSYAPEKILGIFIGLAPIEDFMYAVLAAILVPALWRMYSMPRQQNKTNKGTSNG